MDEFTFLLDPLEFPECKGHGSDGQLLSSLSSSVVDHFTAAFRLHARPEAMGLFPF
jgi:hypothetical protein